MIFGREPVLIMFALQAALGLALAFGLKLSVEQTAAILTLSAAILSVITRQRVSPTVPPEDPQPGV